ncbi:MmgE/PrpD family protein [Salinarimonas sp. NSM]|uniref:MmgE/PrpD family protein n=1 Tax=Salinarimonas sp. NSM TaxID=3458003 RepID=UPI00403517A4
MRPSTDPGSLSGLDGTLDPLTRAIGDHVAGALDRALPEAVREKTRDHLIDTIAATISGTRLPAGEAALRYVRTLGGHPQAAVVGSGGLRTSVVNAALANAMAAHGDETDDFHMASITHPGCGVVPAAMAIAEAEGRSGADLLAAIAVGYDICGRVPVSVDCYRQFKAGRGMHALGGMFGATAAAAALMRFTQRQVADAMSFTVQQASGLTCWRRDEAHIEKAFDFAGMPARNGVMSVGMVACGMPGVPDAMTGVNGLFQVNAPAGFDWAAPWADLATRPEVLSSSIKKWSVGSPGQAALDAVTALIAAHDPAPDEIEEIVIHLPDDVSHIVDEGGAPNVNIRHLVAVCLVDRGLTFASTHDEARLADPSVAALRARARVAPSAELTVARPRRQAIVEIGCKDGRRLRHHARVVRGTPDDPMSREEVLAKARDLIAPITGAERCEAILSALQRIEAMPDLRELATLLID